MNPVYHALTLALAVSLFGAPAAAAEVPSCSTGDEVVAYNGQKWASIVIDTWWRLPSAYAPGDLVPVRRARIAGSGKVREFVIEDLSAMATDARAAGTPLAVHSAYRSFRTQASTFRSWVRKVGLGRALKISARPGHSEHQLGTAIDFKSLGGSPPWLVSGWARQRTGRWLAANAWQYGFVLSYPSGTYRTTCYNYEPWHYRYVGRDVAQAIHGSGQPPRVWLLTHSTPSPSPQPTPTAEPSPTTAPSPTAGPTAEPSPTAAPSPTAEPSPILSTP